MRRIRTTLASAFIATVAATSLAGAAPAQAKWKKLECAPGRLSGTTICLYRDTNNTNRAKGRYINHSGVDLKTKGVFWRYNSTQTIGCAEAITENGTSSKCIRTLPDGVWYVGAWVWYRGQSVGFDSTSQYRFGA